MPEAVVIGGANGAGKSTFARYVLPVEMPFLNADEIAKTLAGDYAGNREWEAGRQLLRRMDALAGENRSFAVETTLASRSLAPRLRDLQAVGYRVVLVFLWVPTPELSVRRVAGRVASGGHDIPTATIYRRHAAGLQNLLRVYLPLADVWSVYTSEDAELHLVADNERIHDAEAWRQIQPKDEHDAE